MASKPIVKKPSQPVAFPPADHLRAYRVRQGDNWWSLQRQFNLRDPWDLIRYNFATRDPAEVNWYLREYVGCTKTTSDGKNYCFSDAAKPGLIYLPRRNFKGGIGGGGSGSGSGSTGSASNDESAKRTVLWVLGLSNTIAALDFDVNGFMITPRDYERVKRLINEGDIHVAHNRDLGDFACYDAATDSLYVGRTGGGDTHRSALLIHETTHAAFDARAEHVADSVSETVAYIAQMLFIMVRDPKAEAPLDPDPLVNDIFRPAWRLAKRIRNKQLKQASNFTATWSEDVLALMKALMAHEHYQDQFKYSDEHYDGLAGYNGVKGWVYS